MKLTVSYKHIEATPAIDEKIEKKAMKLKKYFDGKINVNWICSVEDGLHHSNVTVNGDNFEAHAKSSEDSLYKTLDGAIEKLEKQLIRKKETMKSRIHRSNTSSMNSFDFDNE